MYPAFRVHSSATFVEGTRSVYGRSFQLCQRALRNLGYDVEVRIDQLSDVVLEYGAKEQSHLAIGHLVILLEPLNQLRGGGLNGLLDGTGDSEGDKVVFRLGTNLRDRTRP